MEGLLPKTFLSRSYNGDADGDDSTFMNATGIYIALSLLFTWICQVKVRTEGQRESRNSRSCKDISETAVVGPETVAVTWR